MLAKINQFYLAARGKLTVYVGLLIAASATIRSDFPSLVGMLPSWPWLIACEKHAYAVLGFAVVYARVRRELKQPPP